jgi:hypothetical protein
MRYNATPDARYQLRWGDPKNRQDYQSAGPGQWFLGVLDTSRYLVYLVPSDKETPDAYEKELVAQGGHHVSQPHPAIPAAGWQSKPLQGTTHRGINSPTNNQNQQGGLRQHGRVARAYGCVEDECLGFAVIKLTAEAGEFRDRSNSMNSAYHKVGDNLRMSPSQRSVRMPEVWSNTLKQWLIIQLGVPLQDTVMP